MLPNHSYYLNSRGELHFVGEVKNEITYHLHKVQVSVNLFNSNGQLLDTESAFTEARNLPSGLRTCFDVSFPVPPDSWSVYSFDAPAFRIDGNPFPNLTVIDDQGSYDPVTTEYNILGQIRNDLSTTVESVLAIGTLYNNSGTVVGCNSSFINTVDLDPGQTSAFKITFTGRDYQDATGYLLQVDSAVK